MGGLGDVPIGKELAGGVADALEQGFEISFSHRDYCGRGLCCQQGIFLNAAFFDGRLIDDSETEDYGLPREQPVIFRDKATFTEWLAGQTDQSLAGLELASEWLRNNQRLTRARLEKAVEFARFNPREKWSLYVG